MSLSLGNLIWWTVWIWNTTGSKQWPCLVGCTSMHVLGGYLVVGAAPFMEMDPRSRWSESFIWWDPRLIDDTNNIYFINMPVIDIICCCQVFWVTWLSLPHIGGKTNPADIRNHLQTLCIFVCYYQILIISFKRVANRMAGGALSALPHVHYQCAA